MRTLTHMMSFFILSMSLFSLNGCGNDDDNLDVPKYYYQTEEDIKIENELKDTKWILTKIIWYDTLGNIDYENDYNTGNIIYHLTSQKSEESFPTPVYICEVSNANRIETDHWYVNNGEVISISVLSGKLISNIGDVLIISCHNKEIYGEIVKGGYTVYCKRLTDEIYTNH